MIKKSAIMSIFTCLEDCDILSHRRTYTTQLLEEMLYSVMRMTAADCIAIQRCVDGWS